MLRRLGEEERQAGKIYDGSHDAKLYQMVSWCVSSCFVTHCRSEVVGLRRGPGRAWEPSLAHKMSTQTGKSSGQAPPTADEANSTGDAKLSNAELKKLKQAEKAAKRAAAKGEQGPPSASDARPPKPPGGPDKVQNQSGQQQQTPKSAHQRPKAQDKKLLSLPATSAPTRYPTFHFSSLCPLDYQYATRPKQQLAAASSPDLAEGSTYAPGQPLPTGTVNKCIHHAIRALGLQMQALKVCGSTARCVATLSALKQV